MIYYWIWTRSEFWSWWAYYIIIVFFLWYIRSHCSTCHHWAYCCTWFNFPVWSLPENLRWLQFSSTLFFINFLVPFILINWLNYLLILVNTFCHTELTFFQCHLQLTVHLKLLKLNVNLVFFYMVSCFYMNAWHLYGTFLYLFLIIIIINIVSVYILNLNYR